MTHSPTLQQRTSRFGLDRSSLKMTCMLSLTERVQIGDVIYVPRHHPLCQWMAVQPVSSENSHVCLLNYERADITTISLSCLQYPSICHCQLVSCMCAYILISQGCFIIQTERNVSTLMLWGSPKLRISNTFYIFLCALDLVVVFCNQCVLYISIYSSVCGVLKNSTTQLFTELHQTGFMA